MAQLMLHREVLKKFGKLPSKVQKKTYELIRKFEEDSTQASVNLEPLNVRDKKVRSARVGLDYRAIVIAPEKGDIYLLMYIDHHDEAYRWCQNKRFEAHGSLGTLQVFDVEEVSKVIEVEYAESFQSAIDVNYPLDALDDDELYQAGVPTALIPAVRAVKTDKAFEQLADYLPKEASQVLYGVVMGMGLDKALFEMLGLENDTIVKPASPGDFSHLASITNIDLVLVEGEEHLKEILSEDIEEWRIFLHPYQRKLVEWDVNGPMKINGSAGTGKTVALMHRSVWLADRLQDNERILVTTYTSNLSVTLKGLIEQLSPDLHNKIDVTNLHQLARTVCQRSGWRGKIADDDDCQLIWDQIFEKEFNNFEFSKSDVIDEYNQIIDRMGIDKEEDYFTIIRTGRKRLVRKQRHQLWKVFSEFQRELRKRNMLTFEGVVHQARLAVEHGKFVKYRHVLVDELQDFGLESLKLIKALSPIKEGLPNSLCVVGDGHQRLYGNVPIPLSRAGIEVVGRSRRLKINYRTSEQIRLLAHGFLKGVDVDDLDGNPVEITGDRSIFKGPEPKLIKCETEEVAAEAITVWVKELMNTVKLGSHEICITPKINTIISVLEAAGIRTLELKPRQRDPGQEQEGVRYGTKKRIKGLEFKAVVLIAYTDPDIDRKRFEDYVAATRAREHLLVVNIDD